MIDERFFIKSLGAQRACLLFVHLNRVDHKAPPSPIGQRSRDLVELFNLFSIASVYVGNSTGPTHLAAIADCWVISFYPKIRVASQVRWSPITKKRIIFEPEIDCVDCTVEQCRRLNCMESIDVMKVYKEVEKIITFNLFRKDREEY